MLFLCMLHIYKFSKLIPHLLNLSCLKGQNRVIEMSLFPHLMKKGWGNWTCLAWRREGSRETSLWPSSTYGDPREDGEGLFVKGCSDRRRGNGFKTKEWRFRLYVRWEIVIQMVVRHWHCCPEKLWVLWRHSRPGWVGPGQPDLVGANPVWGTGFGTQWPLRAFKPKP